MTTKEADKIDAAIRAHAAWLTRLNTAVDKGGSEFKPDTVKVDNQCDFGKWLYGEGAATLRQAGAFDEIRDLHAQFHKRAGQILELAVSRQQGEARKLLDPTGDFMQISGKMVLRLKAVKG